MCLLILAEKEFPPDDVLTLGEQQNRNGGGIAWVESDLVHWHKGLKAEEMKVYKKKGPPWMIHFRVATVGGDQERLCHPFPVTPDCSTELKGSAPSVLAHNGHYGSWSRMVLSALGPGMTCPVGPWSDTRGIAFLANVYGDGVLELIDEKVGILSAKNGLYRYGTGWVYFKETDLIMSNNPFNRGGMVNGRDWGRNSNDRTINGSPWNAGYHQKHWQGSNFDHC